MCVKVRHEIDITKLSCYRKDSFMEARMKFNCAYDELVYTHKLVAHPKNPNQHPEDQIERLSKIIDYQGQRSPIVVDRNTGFIVVGHGRLEAMKKLGWDKVAVNYQDFENEAQVYAHMTADNAIGEWSKLDLEKINLDGLDIDNLDTDMLGLKDFELIETETLDPQTDEDSVPELKKDPITKRGDIWILGNHRVMCGDSTMIDDVEKLMNGEKADITFTSPPYNVGKTPNGNKQKYLKDADNKDLEEYKGFLNAFTINALLFSDYVFSNIQSLSGNKIALIEHMYDLRERFADTIIWDKKTAEPAMARRVLNSRFEYIHIFSNEAKRTIGKKDFRGTLSNVFELNSRQGKEYSKIHKATFPVQLPEKFILNFTESSCIDLFCGTGSTLIACEKTKRKCYGMELDEKYCDVIINRWQDYTGKDAVLESTGQKYKELQDVKNG